MSHEIEPQSGDSASGLEYPSALAALEDRQIFAIAPIEGGFEIREKATDEFFVRLLPEQLQELGEEIIALATSATVRSDKIASELSVADKETPNPAPTPAKSHTITIPSGIWDARVTEQFQARIAKLERIDSPSKATTPNPIKPWIKP